MEAITSFPSPQLDCNSNTPFVRKVGRRNNELRPLWLPLLLLLLFAAAAVATVQPNVILIVAEDQGYGDVIRANVEEVDASAGRILDKIRELKLDETTLVIFTSDNGSAYGMGMGPLLGGKAGAKYEGHMREPTIAWLSGTIPAGVESNRIGVTTDILPSLARLAGGEVPTDRKIDGKDVLDVIRPFHPRLVFTPRAGIETPMRWLRRAWNLTDRSGSG